MLRSVWGNCMRAPRIEVVSQFIDKRHGTERNVGECVQRLAGEYEIHVYSNHVEDVDLSRITWHRIPALPGPHLFAFLWWFAANHFCRWRDRLICGRTPGAVFSPARHSLDPAALFFHSVFSPLRVHLTKHLPLHTN